MSIEQPGAGVIPRRDAGKPQESDIGNQGLVRVTIAASVGSFVEYFDLVVYGALAGVLSTVFFPSSDGVASLLKSFAVFALAFAARPLGALFWGRWATASGASAPWR
ncbi:hypothetical protein HJ581_0041420 [Rhodococcus opacus]|nr:hypothetical protein HJ581_0041420 [Rhodococcus opacus]